MDKIVKGYKVFNSDWTCRDKQYTCPGEFEEDVELDVCHCGLHFCKRQWIVLIIIVLILATM